MIGIDKVDKLTKVISIIVLIVLFVLSFSVLLASKLGYLDKLFNESISYSDKIRTIIDIDTTWDYIDTGSDPGLGNVWTTLDYNSGSWKKARGYFAAKQNKMKLYNYDDKYRNIMGSNDSDKTNIPTYFFRYEFLVDDLESIQSIKGLIHYNDAAIVYLNGQVIFAANILPNGYNTNLEPGAAQVIDRYETDYFEVSDLRALKKGANIIAIEVHQESKNSKDAFFSIEQLALYKTKIQEKLPEISSLVLEQGETDSEIRINWINNSRDNYKLEYIEENNYTGDKIDFSKYSKTILMGRKPLTPNTNYARYMAVIDRLKYDTTYLYRIIKLGSNEPSKIYKFYTSSRKQFSLLYLNDVNLNTLKIKPEMYKYITKSNILIHSLNNGEVYNDEAKAIENFYNSFKPIEFKEIPNIVLYKKYSDILFNEIFFNSQFKRENQDNLGNYYIAYKDSLLFTINKLEINPSKQINFIKTAIKLRNRKWNIAFIDLSHTLNSNNKAELKLYAKDLIKELSSLGVNLIFVQADGIDEIEANNNSRVILVDLKSLNKFIYNIKVDNENIHVIKIDVANGSQNEMMIYEP